MGQKKIRDYEVSIWTLQDEFITVLKPSHLEHRGQIEQGKQKILDDGTLSLTFSIPMYLYFGKNRSENPIWHNVKDGTIVANMRKIKVIFNKDEYLDDGFYRDNVFELLIVNVKERHESDQVYCDIECEGLAFHELGKIGYKVSLASDDFYNDDFKFFTDGFWIDSNGEEIESAPRANIQYWLNKFLKPAPETINLYDRTEWYYKIEMNWDSFAKDEGQARKSDIIYEEPYTSSWKLANGILVPDIIESYKEKERLVDLEESNHYNLTQNLAETFGVFCTYRYLYNSNYQIIGREIVFYNNFMKEQEGYLSLTYPYSTAAITREQDSKDLTSKMFVKPVTDEANATGMITIMDVEANRSGEDYLLNFDYLYSINAITDEQYDEIDLFESKMGQLNKKLIELAEQIDALREEKIDVEATLTTATNAIPLDQERITAATALLDNLIKKHGNAANTGIAVTAQNPDSAILLHDANDAANLYYFTLKKTGIDPKSLRIYSDYNYSTHTLSSESELKSWTIEYDEEYGEVNKIKYVNKPNGGIVYFVYTYIPKLYYDKVIDTWTTKLAKDQADKELSETRLNEIENQLSELQIEYDNKLIEKKKALKDFEKMMGPALRESYWMPEDYSNYGDIYTDNFPLVQSSISGASGKTEFIWDTVPFDGEQIGYYEYGINKEKKYYPVISLQGHLNTVQQMLNSLSFIYYDPAITSQDIKLKYARSYPINSKCQYGFARINENNEEKVIPVLILTGYEDIIKTSVGGESDSSLFNSLINDSQLGEYQVNVDGTNVSININNAISSLNFINYNASNASKFDAVELVYPRLKVNSLALKTSSDQLALKYNDKTLNEYEDYSILTRVDANASKGAYYITLRPATLIGNAASLNADVIKFKFTLSNADTAIYLDAKQILKENSVPKVSYTITPSVVDDEFLYTAYNKLSRICNINDTDLKFRNMQGYISEIDLDLDMPWNDKFEIKNYKTKFEDLFSTIVAQSEEMKKSGYTIAQMANNLNDNGEVRASAIEATPLWQDSFDDYFTNSEKVKEYFKRVFDEAGTILRNAASSLDNLQDVSAQNAAILSGFAVNVQNGLAPTYTKSATPPLDFKAGDIWEDSHENRYVATANSADVINAGNGWTQTYDGTFVTKRIQGAKLDIDTEAGTIDMLAENRIDIQSGSDLYIAANDNVAIVGNNSVNIGGAQINIAADGSGHQGGIHLVATDYEKAADKESTEYQSATRVDLTADGLEIFTGGDSTTDPPKLNASATKIDKNGIYLGTNGSINLYSGSLDPNDETSSTTVQLNKDYLIFGASNGSQGTSAKFTNKKIVLAAGDQVDNVTEAGISQNGSISGVLIEKDFIGMATGVEDQRTSAILSPNGIILSAGSDNSGTVMELSSNKIYLGSSDADVRIHSNNMLINTSAQGNNSVFELGTALNTSSPDSKLKMDANGNLSITGGITATSLYIGDKNTQLLVNNGVVSISSNGNQTDLATTNDLIDIKTDGINLLKGTGRGTSSFTVKNAVGGTVTTYDFKNLQQNVRRYGASGAVTNLIVMTFPTYIKLVPGTEYTLSTHMATYSKSGHFRFFYSDDGETFTDDGQLRGEIKAVEGVQSLTYTFTAIGNVYIMVGLIIPSMASGTYVDVYDQWKLEVGNKVTSWSLCPIDYPATELIDGTAIVMTKDQMTFRGPTINLDVSGEAGDTRWDESGMTIPSINSPSVSRRYDGPAAITVSATAEPDGKSKFRTLTDAFAALSNHWLDQAVKITMATNTTESLATLRGVYGYGTIDLLGSGKTLNGRILVRQCDFLYVERLTIAASGAVTLVEVREVNNAYFSNCSFNGTTTDAGSNGLSVSTSSVKVENSGFYNLRNAIRADRGARIYAPNNKGSVAYAFAAVSDARIGVAGTAPAADTATKYEADAGQVIGTTSSSGGSTPPAPTSTTTVSASLTSARTYQSGGSGWLNTTATIQQGLNAGYQHFAIIQFSTSGWSGKTIASGELTIHRLSGGKGGPITVKLMTTASAAGSGTPTGTYTNHGVIGTIDRNETATFSIPAAALQEIANGTRTSLMLYDNGSAWGGRTFSENYAMFSGSSDSISGYRPKLSVTYKT